MNFIITAILCMLRNKGAPSIIRLFYVCLMVIVLVSCVFTTRVTRWQQQFGCIPIKQRLVTDLPCID